MYPAHIALLASSLARTGNCVLYVISLLSGQMHQDFSVLLHKFAIKFDDCATFVGVLFQASSTSLAVPTKPGMLIYSSLQVEGKKYEENLIWVQILCTIIFFWF